MSSPTTHTYEEAHLQPMTVEEINVLTAKARALPPSADQTHVLIDDGEDPWVISHQGYFYYCTVDRLKKKILISKFTNLRDIATAPLIKVWPANNTSAPEFIEIWSPELQFIDGRFFIYFALYHGKDASERMYVLAATSTDAQGSYTFIGKLQIPTDCWAIDGSVLITEDGEKYFIWSGWDAHVNTRQNIYIAKMSDPCTIISDRVCISTPQYEWEKKGYPYVNEGPQALVRNGRIFIIYSASGSWTDDYCLGQLTYIGGDLLNASSWRKEPQPVFSKTESIFAPGHASFVVNGNEDWIIYHAARSSNAGWARQVRAKPFSWKEDGSPDFGEPI